MAAQKFVKKFLIVDLVLQLALLILLIVSLTSNSWRGSFENQSSLIIISYGLLFLVQNTSSLFFLLKFLPSNFLNFRFWLFVFNFVCVVGFWIVNSLLTMETRMQNIWLDRVSVYSALYLFLGIPLFYTILTFVEFLKISKQK